ncbi:hypothetical protein CMI37_25240 [Candidatus Pacearchaeota archaeon]|nr:hypothetical protein [Candidatus Pacearchaeota archaeon]|tara:strand:+ start:1486 stop:1695 length:210 start_codon:yes stop_codon:yes gene_type:complete
MKEKSFTEAFYECTEEVAQVLEKHFEVIKFNPIEDMERINNLVDQEILDGGRRQLRKSQPQHQINGGSK